MIEMGMIIEDQKIFLEVKVAKKHSKIEKGDALIKCNECGRKVRGKNSYVTKYQDVITRDPKEVAAEINQEFEMIGREIRKREIK